MFNVFLLVMLICSVNVSKAQQFDSSAVNNQDLTSGPAAVIQGKVHIFSEGHKILRNLHRRFDRYYTGQI